MTRRRPLFLALACVALIALALGLAACGGDDDDSGAAATTAAATSGATTAPATPVPTESTPSSATATAPAAGTTLDVAADPSGQLKFNPTKLSAPAGEITLDLTNDSPVPHNIAVDGADGVSDTIQDGGTAKLTVNLPAGTYEYYCNIPGHRQAGMVGTLTVN